MSRFYQNPFLLLAVLFCGTAPSSLSAQIDATSVITQTPGQAAFIKTRLGGLDAVTGKISFSLPVGPRLPGRIPAGFILTFDPFYGSGTLRPLVWRLGNAAQTDPTKAFSNTVTLFGNETVFTKPSWNVPLPSDATLQTWMQDRQVDFGRQEADKAVAILVAQYGSQLDGTPVESYVRDAIQTTSDGTKFLIWGHWHITYTLLGTHNDPDPPPGVLDLDKRGIIIDGDMAIFQVGMVTTFTTRWGDKVTITEAGTDAATGSTTALTTFTIQDQVTTGNQIVMTVTGTSGVWPPNAGDKPCWGLAIHVTNTLGGTTLPTADVAAYYQPLSRGPRFTGSTTWLGALVPSSCTETASDGTSRQTNFNFFTIPYTIQYPDQFLEKFIFEPPSTWDWLDNSWDYATGAWAGSNNYGAPSQGQGDYFCGVDRILPDGTGQSVRTQKVVPIGRTIPYTYSWSWTTTGHTTSIYQFPQPTFGQDLPTLQSSLPYRLVKLTHVAMPTTDPTSRQAFLACTSAVVQEEHRHTEATNLGSEVLDQLIQYSAWDLRSWVNPQGIPSIPTTAVAARTTTYTTNLPTQTVFASGRDSYGPTQTQSQTSAPATYSLLDGTEAAQWNDTNPPSPLPGPNLRTATITRALHPIAAQLQTLTEHRTLDGTDFGTTTTTYSPSTGLRTGTTAVRGGGAYTSTDTPVSYQSGQPLPTSVNKTLSGPDIAAGSTGGTDCTYGPAPAFAVTGTMDHIDGRWAISIPDLLGRPTQKTDVLGLVTTFDYDAWGRPWHETRNVGTGLVTTVTHTYDVTGTWKEDLVTTSDGANQTTHSSLDGFGHIVSVITKDSQGNIQTTQTFQFDGFGQKVGQSPVLTTTQQSWGMDTWTYDGQGREITHTDAQGRLLSQVTQEPTWDPIATAVVTRVMGAAVNIAPNVDQSFTRTEVHDLLGHLVAVYDQANQPSLYTYDGDGNLIQASQAGLVRTYGYNPMGFLVYRSEPEEGTTTFTNFTIQGTPLNTTHTGVSNQTPVITVNTVVTPNANLQPANIATSDGSQTLTRTLTYDPTTHLLSGIQDAEPYGTLSEIYSYDALFRCSGKTVTDVSRNRSFSVSQTMNALGSMVSLTYPGGGGRSPQTETLIVDGQNRPWEVLLDVTQFRGQMYYDLVNGTMVTNQLRLGNGASTIWQWDKGVLVDVTHSWGETGNTGQQTNAMTWTAGGLLRSRNQDSFYYDGLLRLTQSIVQGLNSGESINQTFAYDRFGNRTSNQFTYNAGNGGTQPYEVMPWTATYDPAHPNRLPASITGSNGSLATGAAYDDLGRMTEILAVPNNFNLYGTYWTYDARSRIISEEVNGVLGLAYIETMAPNITDRAPLRSSQRVKSCCC